MTDNHSSAGTEHACAKFVMWCMNEGSFQGCDINGGDAQDKAVELGLLKVTTYDSNRHGPSDCSEQGDPWYVPSDELVALLSGGAAQQPPRPVAWRFRYENPSGSFTPWTYRATEPPAFPDRQVEALYASQPPAAPVEECSACHGDGYFPKPDLSGDDRCEPCKGTGVAPSSAATEQATGRYEFPYNRTFQAIAAATSVYAEGVGVNVSVKAFQEAFNSFPDAQPLSEPQSVREPSLRQAEDCLKDWLRYAEENLSEFDVEDGDCCEEKLCPKCESSGCIQYKIRETRIALASLAVTRPQLCTCAALGKKNIPHAKGCPAHPSHQSATRGE